MQPFPKKDMAAFETVDPPDTKGPFGVNENSLLLVCR